MTPQTFSPLFVGYGQLENWLNAINKTRPVFANLITEPGKYGEYGHHTDTLTILVAQPDVSEGIVHYCRVVVGKIQYLGNDPFTPNHQQRLDLAGEAWLIVSAWFAEQSLVVHPGIIAIPANLKLMDGSAGFLGFDQEGQHYIYVRKET
jgi:hypothetical protein